LLSRVIPHLLGLGLRVSVIKHAHHEFDVDVPGEARLSGSLTLWLAHRVAN
jgi:molybdopterin-guanine dinucleotide biosynthesis protein